MKKSSINDRSIVINIPYEIDNKNDLIEFIMQSLSVREFGLNWDALLDILDDLNWLKHKVIHIKHVGFPRIDKIELHLYLDVLNDAVINWKEDGSKRFMISFG
jgi:Barstar (barnase inhibitor)